MKNKNFKEVTLLLLFILIIGCGCGCTPKKEIKKTKEVKEINEKEITNITEPTIEEKKFEIGLYQVNNQIRTLVPNVKLSWNQYQDIISLENFFTEEEQLPPKSQKELWDNYDKQYQEIEEYKIGYQIEFKTKENDFSQIILSPKDGDSIFEYIQTYLYDDIHQTSSWYSHITEEDKTEETIFTSIKLTASTKIEEIISPITIKVFYYKQESNVKTPTSQNSFTTIIERK